MGRFVTTNVTAHKTWITSPLALGRTLWCHGEPDLAQQALGLDPEVVLDIGTRTGVLIESGEANTAWPDGPKYRALLLAVVERLEGSYRPCRLSMALPSSDLPPECRATEKALAKAADPVSRAADERRKAGHPVP
jgi:hypothetical protein